MFLIVLLIHERLDITFYSGFSQLKLNYRKKVFYFALNFLLWEFLLIKKLDF